jgi:hypothetical protein
MAAPARTRAAIAQKLNTGGVNDALAQPEVSLVDLGMDIVGGSPEDATNYVMTQAARVRRLIGAGVLTPE